MPAIVVSDIHLCDEQPRIAGLFFTFLQRIASQTDDLYILGDLFDQWVGDDVLSKTAEQLKTFTFERFKNGQRTFFIPGNRDFLVGHAYCHRAKITLLSDPFSLNIEGKQYVLTHGDKLCTEDRHYQRVRPLMRNSLVQSVFLSLSQKTRIAIGQSLRQRSKRQTQLLESLKVDDSMATKWLQKYRATTLIHGHVHRLERAQIEGGIRMVLSDWSERSGSYIHIDCTGAHLHLTGQ
jgi:UDP-2,3-diacylglucosamine hydrolase